jgi:putative addiction module component (TIGR02574 family)
MPGTREEILEAALRLSVEDRFVIASELLESLNEDLPGLSIDDSDLIAELERRAADREGSIPWEQVRDQLRNAP